MTPYIVRNQKKKKANCRTRCLRSPSRISRRFACVPSLARGHDNLGCTLREKPWSSRSRSGSRASCAFFCGSLCTCNCPISAPLHSRVQGHYRVKRGGTLMNAPNYPPSHPMSLTGNFATEWYLRTFPVETRRVRAILVPARRAAAGTRPAATPVAARPLAGDGTVPACAPVLLIVCPSAKARAWSRGCWVPAKTGFPVHSNCTVWSHGEGLPCSEKRRLGSRLMLLANPSHAGRPTSYAYTFFSTLHAAANIFPLLSSSVFSFSLVIRHSFISSRSLLSHSILPTRHLLFSSTEKKGRTVECDFYHPISHPTCTRWC